MSVSVGLLLLGLLVSGPPLGVHKGGVKREHKVYQCGQTAQVTWWP